MKRLGQLPVVGKEEVVDVHDREQRRLPLQVLADEARCLEPHGQVLALLQLRGIMCDGVGG